MKKIGGKFLVFALTSIASILVGLLFATISYLGTLSEKGTADFRPLFLSNVIRFYVWGILSLPIYHVIKRRPLICRNGCQHGLVTYFQVGLFCSVLHSVVFASLSWILIPAHNGRFPSFLSYFAESAFFGDVYSGLLIYTLIVASMNGLISYQNYLEEQAKSARLKEQLTSAELRALKLQLQPHFLFNTLHSISSLVMDDPPKANMMVARLGVFLRLTLEHSDEQMVTLDEELAFLRCYLEIEQERFQDRLQVKYDIRSEVLTAKVPHLILQPIVENAVKHGIAPYACPGWILIAARALNESILLSVRDSGLGRAEVSERLTFVNGVGLANVHQRLRQIYGDGYRLEAKYAAGNGLSVHLLIPANYCDVNDPSTLENLA